MHLADKLGDLENHENISGYNIEKRNGKFIVTVRIKQKNSFMAHVVRTKGHNNLLEAVDEAIELFREHLSDCSLC